MPNTFQIEIRRQGWLTAAEAEPYDLCSHGEIHLAINGITITPPKDQNHYTISSSALALLRTLNGDRPEVEPDADALIHSANRLILHCGQTFLQSCPIGIDWSVRHTRGQVHLSDFRRWDTCSDDSPVLFGGASGFAF